MKSKDKADSSLPAAVRNDNEDLICGLHAVAAALQQHPERLDGLWVSSERVDRRVNELVTAARAAGVRFQMVPRVKLDRMAEGERHQGVIARLRAATVKGEAALDALLAALPPMPLLLILDGVQDPHNLGACLRSADAAGVHGVIVPRERSAPVTAAARRAASGAAETVPIFEVVNLARTLRVVKEAGIWLIGATQDAPEPIYATDLRRPLGLVLGGEGKGLRRLTREHCDLVARIPMVGQVASLNVSVATGICLYEAVRQRAAR